MVGWKSQPPQRDERTAHGLLEAPGRGLGYSHNLLGTGPARSVIGEHNPVAAQVLGAVQSPVRARQDIGKYASK